MTRMEIAFFATLITLIGCRQYERIDLTKDLSFLPELTSAPCHEVALFDYLCRSRYWMVGKLANGIRATLVEEGEEEIFGKNSSSTICFEFISDPAKNMKKGKMPGGNAVYLNAYLADKEDSHVLRLSDNAALIVNDNESILDHKRFKESAVSYFQGVVNDIVSGRIGKRLEEENSVELGYDSFGIGDVDVHMSEYALDENNYIQGWINPGIRAFVHAKIYDENTGKRIGVGKAFRSVQYVGFDSDVKKRFFFKTPLCVDGDGEEVRVKIELFASVTNSPIYVTNAVLRTWRR